MVGVAGIEPTPKESKSFVLAIILYPYVAEGTSIEEDTQKSTHRLAGESSNPTGLPSLIFSL